MAIVDVDRFKHINDRYGHDHGDEYLRANVEAVCGTFAASPVFRTGGDEFVAILEGDEYRRRGELLERLERTMEASWQEAEPWRRLWMAWGIGIYQAGDATVNEVFRRADQAMYETKRRMKALRDNGAYGPQARADAQAPSGTAGA